MGKFQEGVSMQVLSGQAGGQENAFYAKLNWNSQKIWKLELIVATSKLLLSAMMQHVVNMDMDPSMRLVVINRFAILFFFFLTLGSE